ncbi:MAG TPA: hypothetical protein VFB63_26110 [Bryobacteraceae bacterium]|jgi:hypothetical protein|nr:hypothetical protein [Bryobacteraceae bacterium]
MALTPTLVYHAICFAEKISCTSAAFQQLWKQKLAWSAVDERLMQAFRKAIDFSGAPVKGTYPFLPNYPAFYGDERRNLQRPDHAFPYTDSSNALHPGIIGGSSPLRSIHDL